MYYTLVLLLLEQIFQKFWFYLWIERQYQYMQHLNGKLLLLRNTEMFFLLFSYFLIIRNYQIIWGDRVPARNLPLPNKAFCTREWVTYNQVFGWGGLLGIPKPPRLLPKLLVAFHTLMLKPHYWRKNLQYSLNMEKLRWCLSRPSPYRIVFMVLEETLHTTKGERQTPNQLQTLWSTMVTCLQDTVVQ